MPAHDWSRVDTGAFHHFHAAWITHLAEEFNRGMLPEGYYALAEQHAGRTIPDVLTLSLDPPRFHEPPSGAVAIAESPPKTSFQMELEEPTAFRLRRRTLAIRHQSGHRLVAMVEIVSEGNKDGERHLRQFIQKVASALQQGIHLLVIDLLPPGPANPHGIHGAIWEEVGGGGFVLPPDRPLTLAAYLADELPVAYVEPLAVGQPLKEMPLFLSVDWYVPAPLEATYMQSFGGLPRFLQARLESQAS